jgi:glutathione synthase/RimK-type ligase-like ATP-grasp enzyme
MTRIAVLRCEKLPSFVTWDIPNLDELFQEDELLIRGFRSDGFQAEPVPWSSPGIDWRKYDIALIRSTWDYIDERDRFLRVLSEVEASSCRLFNPLSAVRWNIDKHYLFDLAQWGIPIIPTCLASGLEKNQPENLFHGHRAETAVLKPVLGLGASHSYRVPFDAVLDKLTELHATHPQREYLVQPFIEDILTEGEWSFIYFNRRLSHVFIKRPAPGDYRVQGIYGGTVEPAEPSPRDLLRAGAAIQRLPFDVLYTRLDFVRVDGELAIIEVELIEPIFDFRLVPQAVRRLVSAVRSRLDGKR